MGKGAAGDGIGGSCAQLNFRTSVAHAKSPWDQTATLANERIKPALLPRTDTGPLPAPPSARVGMTIGMSRLAQRGTIT